VTSRRFEGGPLVHLFAPEKLDLLQCAENYSATYSKVAYATAPQPTLIEFSKLTTRTETSVGTLRTKRADLSLRPRNLARSIGTFLNDNHS